MTVMDGLTRVTGEIPRVIVSRGRHQRRRWRVRVPRLPRRAGAAVLLVAGLVQAAAAIGWVAGYGWSPAGVIAASCAAVTLAVRLGVRW